MSYTAADQVWAEWIAWQLEEAGYTVLLQAWDMVPGSNWLHMMNQATRFAERTVAVLSAAYLSDSPFGEAEWLAAYRRDPAGLASRVIPIRVGECTVDGLLAGIVYADLVGLADRAAAWQALLEAVRAALTRRSKPLVEPSFPGLAPTVPAGPVRSGYLAKVRQIAPRELVGRDTELAAMTAFCTDAAAGPYVWWRAAAWTGKTALMSTWVLDPPAGVRAVSFFVTARLAGNSDRYAYVEVVSEQLATLLGQSVPPYLNRAGQERLYWSLLDQAAERCRRDGQRLVLVVDGLDEDLGAAGGRSIAALLPTNPPAGMRVVVAGRPDPPIPADVPPGHPLRDPDAVWLLRRSARAAAVRADMLADLARLREGGPLGRDVLGLITAAGGGLSSRDLAELCQENGLGTTDWDVEQLLATVAGRSFASRDGQWSPPVVYLLGHEEIQQEATRSYGSLRLAGYQARLHDWARRYRDRSWPPDTPEYLLRGYFRLLRSVGDVGRGVDCATDLARHDRMLDLSGGDTAALAEITELQNTILAAADPDLASMARLAYQRGRIEERNSNIPAGLPAVWATLGHAERAEQLALAITNPGVQDQALGRLAEALVRAGDHERGERVATAVSDPVQRAWTAIELAEALARAEDLDRARAVAGRAETMIETSTVPADRARALGFLAAALAAAGDHERAHRVAGQAEQAVAAIEERASAGWTTSNVAGLLSRAGDLGRAERVAGRSLDPAVRAAAFGRLAEALAEGGDPGRARAAARDAELATGAIADKTERAESLGYLAAVLAKIGDADRARALIDEAEQMIGKIADPPGRVRARGVVAGALAEMGEHDRAERLARIITDDYAQEQAWTTLVAALVRAGDLDGAERVARIVTDPPGAARMLNNLATVLARAGETGRAERIAAGVTGPADPGVLSDIAGALAEAGDHEAARAMADRAEQIARTITDTRGRARALAFLGEALTEAGDPDRAERLAGLIAPPAARAWVLQYLAVALARAGDQDGARTAADRAERVIGAIAGKRDRAAALGTFAQSLAKIGAYDRAERTAVGITEPFVRAWALSNMADLLVLAGEADRAGRVAGEADRATDFIVDVQHRISALTDLARTLVAAGEPARARAVAAKAELAVRPLLDPQARAEELSDVASALVRAGDPERADVVTGEAEQVARGVADHDSRDWILSLVAERMAEADPDRAERIAGTIDEPDARGSALSVVAGALANAGRLDRAERVARAIGQPSSRAAALGKVAEARANAGDHARARALAAEAEPGARISYGESRRGLVLCGLATTFAGTGDPGRARALLAFALSGGEWGRLPLSEVGALAPEVLTSLADCAEREGPGRDDRDLPDGPTPSG